VLLVNARHAVSAEKLADLVWDGAPPPAAATTLRSYLSNLRKALGAAGALLTRERGYLLDVPEGAIDAEAFQELAAKGHKALLEGDAATAAKLLGEALGLWRGDALEDFAYAAFAQVEAGRLEHLRVGAVEDLMEARLALGEHAELTAQLESLTKRHPLRERLWRSRLLALARSGRPGEALEAYEDARRHLAEELGIDPSPELRRVHESIVRQSDDVETQRPARAASGAFIASFVFTDVERSTRMLQALGEPERYAEVMQEQRRLIRDVFDARGSRYVLCVGEELFVAFDSATAAVRAALDAQLALRGHDWGEAGEVRVRMGVHTGETTILGGEYVGLSVHLASRICDAAHGGQVLISQASADLLDAAAIAPGGLVEAGSHLLKDFDEPVRLHQLVHPDLRRDFPPLRTLSAMPHNLPPRLTSLVGRDSDVAEIASLVEGARLVTLTGVGGVGKTRLALEVGARVLPLYPDGVWLCELAPVTTLDGIVTAISEAIGVQGPSVMASSPPREMLVAALQQRRTLVVLDNCEHVLEPVAGLIDEILRECPQADVLATSREGIGVRGEQIVPVRSLRVPAPGEALSGAADASAVKLFVERTRAVRRDFELGSHNAGAVVDICRRLDGIPLAIELAAARTSSMGPLEIAARVDKAFRFLRSGERTAVERHRTLRGAIDWSYALLTPDEQRLFERLSVFTGGFTLEAVEQVCVRELDIDAADGLDSLVAKHLVSVDLSADKARCSMLETIRQYARDKLSASGDEWAVCDAHGDYLLSYIHSIEQNLSPQELVLSLDFRGEVPNVRAAFDWAVASGNIDRAIRLVAFVGWFVQSNLPSAMSEWIHRAIELPGIESHDRGPVCLGLAAYLYWGQSEFERAHELADRALALAPRPDDERRIVALSAKAAVLMFEGRGEEAERVMDELIALESQDPTSGALWRVNRALVAGYGGDRARALALLEEAKPYVGVSAIIRDQFAYALAETLDEKLDPDAVIAAAERAHAGAVASSNTMVANLSLLRAASVRGRYRDPVASLREYARIIDGWRLGGNHSQQWLTLLNLAELFARVGSDEAALVVLGANDARGATTGVYGEQEARLELLEREIRGRLGPARAAAAHDEGTDMLLADVVRFALDQIDASLLRLERDDEGGR
jgi:predicted ATPase/DNA-binding SARP family transcriptional activator